MTKTRRLHPLLLAAERKGWHPQQPPLDGWQVLICDQGLLIHDPRFERVYALDDFPRQTA